MKMKPILIKCFIYITKDDEKNVYCFRYHNYSDTIDNIIKSEVFETETMVEN